MTGDLGVSPGTTVNNAGTLTGAIHLDDAAAIQAQTGLVATYDDAAGRLPGVAVTDHLSPGHYVYRTKQVDMNVYFAGLESGGEQMMRPLVLSK